MVISIIKKNEKIFAIQTQSNNINIIDSFLYCEITNTLNIIIYNILRKALQNDSWILQIYQLSLSQQSKRFLLNTWCETINNDQIYLYLRHNYQHMYSKELHSLLQKELSNNFEKLIVVHIIKNNNCLKKTPIEYIYMLYKDKILQLSQELLKDPYIKLVQSLFNAKFDAKSIELI